MSCTEGEGGVCFNLVSKSRRTSTSSATQPKMRLLCFSLWDSERPQNKSGEYEGNSTHILNSLAIASMPHYSFALSGALPKKKT